MTHGDDPRPGAGVPRRCRRARASRPGPREHFRAAEVVSSDALRAVVGSGEHDLDASADAFALLDAIVAARVGRGLTVVVDTLGHGARAAARASVRSPRRRDCRPSPSSSTPTRAECRARNRARDRPVPATVLDAQLARMREVAGRARRPRAGTSYIGRASSAASRRSSPLHSPGARTARGSAGASRPSELGFVLQLSSFPWGEDPIGLAGRRSSTPQRTAGFEGIALMDHLIQIPQVGRAWDPLPEPFVTLGALAGLAARTGRPLRLGTLVTPVTFRQPGVVAKAVATLDVLSRRRRVLRDRRGLVGARARGVRRCAAAGARADGRSSATAIETLRALWSPGTKAYAGERVDAARDDALPAAGLRRADHRRRWR